MTGLCLECLWKKLPISKNRIGNSKLIKKIAFLRQLLVNKGQKCFHLEQKNPWCRGFLQAQTDSCLYRAVMETRCRRPDSCCELPVQSTKCGIARRALRSHFYIDPNDLFDWQFGYHFLNASDQQEVQYPSGAGAGN